MLFASRRRRHISGFARRRWLAFATPPCDIIAGFRLFSMPYAFIIFRHAAAAFHYFIFAAFADAAIRRCCHA
jgi:hypothetical protein